MHPCIAPLETGVIDGKVCFSYINFLFFSFDLKISKRVDGFVQVLTGLTDAQLENLDMIEGDEYVRKTVEVVLTVSFIFTVTNNDL